MADLFILALTVFTFQNNTKIAINIYLLDIFALFLVFSYQFTAKCLSLPPPLLGGAISKPLTLPFALAFRTSNIETVTEGCKARSPALALPDRTSNSSSCFGSAAFHSAKQHSVAKPFNLSQI